MTEKANLLKFYALRLSILLCLSSLSTVTHAQSKYNFPREIRLVFDYIIQHDYPELFNNKQFQFRPVAWAIHDMDDDGRSEVFLQTFPHYRQSPTITIYQIDEQDSVHRVTEGFAPGHLKAISKEEDYFDTHSTGTALDMELGAGDLGRLNAFARMSLIFGMSPVIFNNFVHTDKREGKPTFLDLSYLKDLDGESSCEHFQFAQPDAIVAGKIKGEKYKYFLAVVGDEMYCYQIRGFEKGGYIDKHVIVIQKPQDFKSFIVQDDIIKYETIAGEIKGI